jgi:hypothetical protein
MFEQLITTTKASRKNVDFGLRQIMYNHTFHGPDDLVCRNKVLVYVGAKQNVIRTKDFLLAMHWYRASHMCEGGLSGSAFLISAYDSYKELYDERTIIEHIYDLKKLSIKNIDYQFHFCDPQKVLSEQQIISLAPYLSSIRNCSFPERLKPHIYKQKDEL